ncbi:hypothetical protein MRB53_041745 [Persea americana]|nr:hypothetical protein MRB53_041745 [Persea americana]
MIVWTILTTLLLSLVCAHTHKLHGYYNILLRKDLSREAADNHVRMVRSLHASSSLQHVASNERAFSGVIAHHTHLNAYSIHAHESLITLLHDDPDIELIEPESSIELHDSNTYIRSKHTGEKILLEALIQPKDTCPRPDYLVYREKAPWESQPNFTCPRLPGTSASVEPVLPSDPRFGVDDDGHGTAIASIMVGQEDRSVEHNLKVINLSASTSRSDYVDGLAERIVDICIHFVCAAGNSNTNSDWSSPSNVDGVLSIGSIDNQDRKADESNLRSQYNARCTRGRVIAATLCQKQN